MLKHVKTRAKIAIYALGAITFSALSFIHPLTQLMYGAMGGYYGMDVLPAGLPPKVSIHRGIWGFIFGYRQRRIRMPRLSG